MIRPSMLHNILLALVLALLTVVAFAQASLIPSTRLINPEDLVKTLQSSKAEKPLMIQVGSHVLYSQAHIPGSEYIGPPPVMPLCNNCANASSLCRETSSSLFIVDVALGAIVPTSSPQTTPCTPCASPT